MRKIKLFVFPFLIAGLGGCSVAQGGKLWFPNQFGLEAISHNLYVEPATDEITRQNLKAAMIQAEAAVRKAYGDVTSAPIVNVCITEECYAKFGGRGSVAKVYGKRILLSPRGLNWHFLAHEWSHAEMNNRLTFSAWWRMPQWFDEGVAVTISEAPEHSEEHWKYLVDSNIPRPSKQELMTYRSLSQWLGAVKRYGETENIQRKAKGEVEIRPVYTAAGHEIRPWLKTAGVEGLRELIERINKGEDFDEVYHQLASRQKREVDTSPK